MRFSNKRKLITISLVLGLLFLLLFAHSAFASTDARLSAGNESGAVGETVTVSINMANGIGLEGGQFDLIYDPSVVNPIRAARGNYVPDTSGNLFDYNLALESGRLRVLWVTAAGSSIDSGTVGTITFELLRAGESELAFRDWVIDAPPGKMIATPVPGLITVTADPTPDDKAEAIRLANEAIAALPDPATIGLTDRTAVENARSLVARAKGFGAVDADFPELFKLEAAERRIAKLDAIRVADEAILALPSLEALTLNDKPAVVAARALVDRAKLDHGAVDADFLYLARLVAAENRIKELEGETPKPTPPTGGMTYLIIAAMLLVAFGAFVYFRRDQVSVK